MTALQNHPLGYGIWGEERSKQVEILPVKSDSGPFWVCNVAEPLCSAVGPPKMSSQAAERPYSAGKLQ